MELIPILSTIILVATISTFLLAIGAYILFKIRESKIEKYAPKQPGKLQAEYIAPKEPPVRKVFVEDILEPKTVRKSFEERFKPVMTPVEISAMDKDFSDSVKRKTEARKAVNQVKESHEEKYVKLNTLHFGEQEKNYKPGEIKWR